MKKIFSVLLSGLLCSGAAFSQSPAPIRSTAGSMLQLKEGSFDFGPILQGRLVSHDFEIVNSGPDTLKLENVQASCGCTTPVWSKEPVAPNGSTRIKVGYNALAEGSFDKSVNIFYNGGQVKSVVITGNVYKSPATPAPVNTSISLLKQIN